jgi:ribonuclease Z
MKMYPSGPLEVLPHSRADPNYPESTKGQELACQAVLTQMPRYADALRTLESAPEASLPTPNDYGITVTPFGTGSAIPSKYRNGKFFFSSRILILLITLAFPVSSTLVDIPGFGGVLLDAGEGTLGQMRRRFGTRGMAEDIYPNLRMIYISHMHADHHLGLRLILEDRLKVRNHSLLIKCVLISDHDYYSTIRNRHYISLRPLISFCTS